MQFLAPLTLTLAAALSAALPVQAADGGLRYRIKPVPRIEGAVAMFGSDINNLGDVTGTFRLPRGITRGFIYRNGVLEELPTGGSLSPDVTARAINDLGEVAGSIGSSLVVFRNGSVVPLGPALGNLVRGEALAINNAGVTTGRATVAPSSSERPFLHDGTTGRLLSVSGESSPYGFGINDAGDVLIRDGAIARDYYLYRDGRTTRLPDLRPDDPRSQTDYLAINNAGQVLGSQFRFGSIEGGNSQFFIYQDGRADLVTPPDGGIISAFDLNDQGWVVGLWDNHLGFLYRDGQMHALEDLIHADYVGRWNSFNDFRINASGQITGRASFFGRTRAFVATPVPEPGTTALMLVGLGAVGWMARARRQRGPRLHGDGWSLPR